MKELSEILRFFIACMVPISIMGFAAFLIYKQTPGWGWFLFATVLILGSTKVHLS